MKDSSVLLVPFGVACGAALSSQWRVLMFSLNPCFRHAILTATIWVNAASVETGPITGTYMVLQRARLPPSPSVSPLVCSCVCRAVGCTTDKLCCLTKKTKQKYWPFKPDDTVNMGKVRQLCVYFI